MTPSPAAIELREAGACARVNPIGAELAGLSFGGRQLLWSGDPRWWHRSAPLLFPLVGRLRDGLARFGALATPMPIHGFAASSPFEVLEHSPAAATLRLQSDVLTRDLYPFAFELIVTYRLDREHLDVTLELRNGGEAPMPWSMGLHPGFRWPWGEGSAAGYALVFSSEESPQVPVITAEGLFTAQHRTVPLIERRLALEPALFEQEALCFLDARSRAVRLIAPDGSAIDIASEGFAHWALWSPPGAPFLCIESWTGHGDRHDWEGDFADRPSTRILAPGASACLSQRMRYRAAEGR